MKILYSLLFILFCASCDSSNLGESVSIPNSQWNVSQKLKYTIPVSQGKGIYDIHLVVRNNDEYSYQNLWLFVENNKQKDTLQYMLADEKGQWLGTGMGNTKEIELTYKKNQPLNANDTLHISIQHGMRTQVLNGIEDISVILNKIK